MDLEQQIRRAIGTEANRRVAAVGDVESMLDRVRSGARRRRRNRAIGGTVAVLAVVSGAVGIVQTGDLLSSHDVQVADTPRTSGSHGTSTATSTAQATAGSLSGLQVLSMTATDPRTFWVLGSSGCARPRCLTIEGTSNGGAGFTRLATPPSRVGPPTTSTTVSGLRFASGGTDGWAFGGALWATHNGGASWVPVELGAPDDRVVELEVWRTTAYAVLAHGDRTVDLFSASVGSDNWKPVRTSLWLTDAAGGLAVSDSLVAFLAHHGDRTVLASGTTAGWTEQHIPCPLGAPNISANKDSLWLLCSSPDPRAYTSPDAGATWSRVAITLGSADVIAARGPDRAVVASSREVEVLAGGSGQVAYLPSSTAAYAVYTGFTDDKTGYLVLNDGSLLRTSNSGLEWKPVRLPQ
jgi:hypothetical protein